MTDSQPALFLVRHAQGSLGTGDYDRLSATGFRQAELLGRYLHGELGCASLVRGGLRRHRETAEYLQVLGECRVDADLDEYRVDSLLQAACDHAEGFEFGLPGPDAIADPRAHLARFLELFPRVLEAWQHGRLACEVNGLWSAFCRRIDGAARRLDALLATSNAVVAVTSAGVISTMAARLLEADLAWQRRLNVTLYNASVTELRLGAGGRWKPARINCVNHLPPGDLHTLA
ncbi:MAG: histidine phosphatase family protein [Wenzhouxiangellaceae bacterium]|nr:histidine phosphatase family protein [Wenzhouxiangellaceae bacterium]